MSLKTALNPLDVTAAKELCNDSEIVVVDSGTSDVVERYRLLRYSGAIRGKGRETFAVKNSSDKFFVRSENELGLNADSQYQAFLASDFDSIDLRD